MCDDFTELLINFLPHTYKLIFTFLEKTINLILTVPTTRFYQPNLSLINHSLLIFVKSILNFPNFCRFILSEIFLNLG